MEMKQDRQQREIDQFIDGNHPILMQFINEEMEKKKRCRFSVREIWQVKYRQALKQFLDKERGKKNREQQEKDILKNATNIPPVGIIGPSTIKNIAVCIHMENEIGHDCFCSRIHFTCQQAPA